MTRLAEDQPLVPSILDRLIDENPENTREPIKMRNQVISELREKLAKKTATGKFNSEAPTVESLRERIRAARFQPGANYVGMIEGEVAAPIDPLDDDERHDPTIDDRRGGPDEL